MPDSWMAPDSDGGGAAPSASATSGARSMTFQHLAPAVLPVMKCCGARGGTAGVRAVPRRQTSVIRNCMSCSGAPVTVHSQGPKIALCKIPR